MALKRTRGAGAARTGSPAATHSVPEHFQDHAPEVRGTYELVQWLKNGYDPAG